MHGLLDGQFLLLLSLQFAKQPVTVAMSERLFDGNLHAASKSRKCDVINAFWPNLRITAHELIEDDYTDLLQSIDGALRRLAHLEEDFADRFVGDFLGTISIVREHQDVEKMAVVDSVTEDRYLTADRKAVLRSVELAARLWLGVNICSRTISLGPSNPNDTCIAWPEDRSLSQLVAEQFERKAVTAIDDDLTLDMSLTAVELMKKRGVRVRWTESLLDHLKLEGQAGERSLSIYAHKLRLINHHKDLELRMFPRAMLEEAICTLDLLFPVSDPETIDFLSAENIHFNGLAPYDAIPALSSLNEFVYWRRNLEQLLRLLHGPPETTGQMLRDKRNLIGLWVGVLGVLAATIIFGVIATALAAMQYVVAVRSYDLALAQACLQYPELTDLC